METLHLADLTTSVPRRPEFGGPLFATSAASSYSVISTSRMLSSTTAHFVLPLLLGYSYFLVASPRDASGGESLYFRLSSIGHGYRLELRIPKKHAYSTSFVRMSFVRLLASMVSSRSPTGFSFDEGSGEIIACSAYSERPPLLPLSDKYRRSLHVTRYKSCMKIDKNRR